MEPAVTAALIALAGSILVTIGNIIWTSRQNEKTRAEARHLANEQQAASEALEQLRQRLGLEAKEEEWHLDERKALAQELRRYRLPLLEAADDLGHRINNIRNGSFLAYLGSDSERRDVAVQSTAFRIARYFAVLEVIHERIGFLPFERKEDVKDIAAILAEIGRIFAKDAYDRNGRPWYRAQFMIWREEQRAMGEIVRERSDGSSGDTLIGFATFTENWNERNSVWFARFIGDLESGNAAQSVRLQSLQSNLAELVLRLDDEGRYRTNAPAWIRMSQVERTGNDERTTA